MCTAYELGRRGGSFPSRVNANAAGALLDLDTAQRIVRPNLGGLVVRGDGELVEMTWGFRRKVPGKTKLVWKSIVNSRTDNLDSRMWKKAFEERRCIIPMSGFYEWTGPKTDKRPLLFDDPQGKWLWVAGIWEDDPENSLRFSALTTEPNTQIAPVHDRLLRLLSPDEIDPYLDGEMVSFEPTSVVLRFNPAANFLTGETQPRPEQGELF